MGTTLTTLLLALAVGTSAYFLVSYALTKVSYRKVARSRVLMAQMVIAEAEQRRDLKLLDRLTGRIRLAGWTGGLAPIVTAVGFLYAVCVLLVSLTGINEVVGVVLGIPICIGVVSLVVMRIAFRRQSAFQRQLMPALAMLAAQIETGSGAERALESILPSLEDPLGEELNAALAATVTMELVESLKEVEKHYPSRAFTLFLAALEIDRLQGGSLAPALREAASMLERQFELTQEAQAELSQAKSEFYGVIVILSLVALPLLTSGDPTIRSAYFSPTGLTALTFVGILAGLGVLRASKIFKMAKRGSA